MSVNSITYRLATVEDILVICELGQILNAIHHQARPDIYAPATTDIERDRQHWLPGLQEDGRAIFLAEDGTRAVGFITAQIVRPTGSLLQPALIGRVGSIGVLDEMHGRGIGRALMTHAEAWARSRGATDMRLTVWTFNERAVRVYRELGYEVRAFEMGRPL